jgi:Pvc16 N-terminal domain
MFQDLDDTLRAILGDSAMPDSLADLHQADVSFITPDKNFTPAQATVDFFLYDVKENRELRDPTPILEKVGTRFIRRPPPVRIDCSYIVTTWSGATGAVKVAEEHRLLGQALLWLSRFPTIPAAYLQGTLKDELYPPPTMVAQLDPNKNAGEFWDALDIPPRPAFYLTVTVAMELGTQVTGPLVTTRSSNVHAGASVPEERWVQIGGRVLGPPVTVVRAQATVSGVFSNRVTVTAAEDAANFRPGDVALLQQGTTQELGTVASINGSTIILERNLINAFTGGIIRTADLIPGQHTVRVASTTGIEPGTYVSITQAATAEEHIVQAVDPARDLITLTQGLTQTYMMADGTPVNLVPGIADAFVDIVDAGLRARSASDGRYSFPRVPVGTRSIRVVAVGFEPRPPQPLVVPGLLPEQYDVTLTPL